MYQIRITKEVYSEISQNSRYEEQYEQTVDELDVKAVIAVVNGLTVDQQMVCTEQGFVVPA